MAKTLRYPQSARESKTDGNVILSYRLNSDHKITDVKVEKGIGSGCDEAALNAIRSFNGIVGKTPGQYYLAAVFALQGYTKRYQSLDTYRSKPNFAGVVVATGYINTPPPPPIESRKKAKNVPTPPLAPPTSASVINIDRNEGLNAFYKFIGKHVRYPSVARENGTTGTVIMNFDVKDGKLSHIKIYKGILPIADNEVARVLGIYDENLNVPAGNYYIPVSFIIVDLNAPTVPNNSAMIAGLIPKKGKSTILNEVIVTTSKPTP